MRYATSQAVSIRDLVAMSHGVLENTITDMDFLETLARRRCFLVPPWVMQAGADGQLSKVTRVMYSLDGELDKPGVLLAVARKLREAANATKRARFWNRFGD